MVGTLVSFPVGSVGEGDFAVPEDRDKLKPVLKATVARRLRESLQTCNFPAYRRYFNLQSVYFRGLPIEPVADLIPGFEFAHCDPDEEVVAKFLYQNGLRSVGEVDSAGWSAVHYAALGGNAELLAGLLRLRADINRQTSREEPELGCPPWTTALALALGFRHNEAEMNSRDERGSCCPRGPPNLQTLRGMEQSS